MDFFEEQRLAKQRSRLLYGLYVFAVLAISGTIYLLGLPFFQESHTIYDQFAHPSNPWSNLWNPQAFLVLFGGSMAAIGLGSLYKIYSLMSDASTVAVSMGGRRVDPASSDPDERRLLNVVEEMAIASGMPVPDVYILDQEPGINAFATGFSPSNAVIGITQGSTRLMTRDELQGVVAHEFSHILHGDTVINVRAIGLLHGILLLRILGGHMIRSMRYNRDRKGNGALIALFGVGLVVLGALGVLFARMIQAAISRQREVLADASAVQFTRDNVGLSNALKKIGGYTRGGTIYTPDAIEARHFFFADASYSRLVDFGIFRTHPPLEERIRKLEPSWDGTFPKVQEPTGAPLPSPFSVQNVASDMLKRPMDAAFLGAVAPVLAQSLASANVLHKAVNQAGNPTGHEVKSARKLCANLPPRCLAATRQPGQAQALVCGVLMSRDSDAGNAQYLALVEHKGETWAAQANNYADELASANSASRLALIDLSIPVLRHLSQPDYLQFKAVIEAMIRSDSKVDLFEYALRHSLSRHLERAYGKHVPPRVAYRSVQALVPSASVLISALAWYGSKGDDQKAQQAFAVGVSKFSASNEDLSLLSFAECNLQAVDRALKIYEQAADMLKKNLIFACAHTVGADGEITDREAELLRAVGEALDCPIPQVNYS